MAESAPGFLSHWLQLRVGVTPDISKGVALREPPRQHPHEDGWPVRKIALERPVEHGGRRLSRHRTEEGQWDVRVVGVLPSIRFRGGLVDVIRFAEMTANHEGRSELPSQGRGVTQPGMETREIAASYDDAPQQPEGGLGGVGPLVRSCPGGAR